MTLPWSTLNLPWQKQWTQSESFTMSNITIKLIGYDVCNLRKLAIGLNREQSLSLKQNVAVNSKQLAYICMHSHSFVPSMYVVLDTDRAILLREERLTCLQVSKADRKSTRLNSSHSGESRMPSSA